MKENRRYVMTKRAEKAEEAKARILASAVHFCSTRPVDGFTIEEVANSAGVSVRTVLRAFGSKEELVLASLFELAEKGEWLTRIVAGEVADAVTMQFDIYESVGDLILRLLDAECGRPALKAMLDQGRRNHEQVVKSSFAPQLAGVKGAACDELLTMLILLTDVYIWRLLRRDMGYSRRAAEAIVRNMIERITERRPDHGEDPLVELVRRRKPAAQPRYRASPD